MTVISQAALPFSRIAHELVGSNHGAGVCVLFVDAPPGDGPSLHRHPYEEVFIVQEGRGTFTLGDEELEAAAGEIVIAPAGVPHRFVNTGDGPLKQIDIHVSPSFSTEWLDGSPARMPKGNLAPGQRVSDLLRAPAGALDLGAIDTRATPGFDGDKAAAAQELEAMGKRLAALQEQLYAEGRSGGSRSVLLVMQGMDTSGKGGTVKHVVGHVDPGGVRVASFGKPTDEELEHDFLWRIRAQLPRAGEIGVFDRSHYEDVVAVRVLGLVDDDTVDGRFEAIEAFEAELATGGVRIVKCFLHISPEEQRERLLARLDDPTKHWKYKPGDLDTRERWDDYMAAYAAAIERTNSELAPWHVVPADRKWYRNWAVMNLLVEQFDALGLRWPEADFDVEAERERLQAMP